MELQELRDEPLMQAPPAGFSLAEVVVRLVRPDERIKWDVLMDQHHYLGFKRFAGRGLRYVAEWRGRWIALAGWQAAALKCAPRDRWIGWRGKKMFKRLHLIANNTRFLVLGERGVFANLGSCMLSAMVRRLSDDWLQQYGHRLLAVESFVDPAKFTGTMYAAANWSYVGNSKGYARCNGHYTDPHGKPKRLYVRALRSDACDILRQRGELADCWQARVPTAGGNEVDKRSLYEELQKLPDHRRGQGRKHSLATVLAVYLLAMLSNMRGPVAAAEYAQALDQEELKLVGAWRNRTTGRHEPPTKSTIHRVRDGDRCRGAGGDAAALCDGPRGGSRRTGPTAGTGGRRQAGYGAPIATARCATRPRRWSSTPPACRSRASTFTTRTANWRR